MTASPMNALLVLLYGLAAGVVLWLSGMDIALQLWLNENYNQTFNDKMRWLSDLALGRTQVWALIMVGLGAALYQGGLNGAWRALRTTGQQVLAWLRGRWAWVPRWQEQPRLARLCLLAIPLLAVTGMLQVALKFLIGRPRPKDLLWHGNDPYQPHPFVIDSTFWSLPSGHSTSTFMIFTWLALGLPRWRIPLFLTAAILSSSRFLAVTPHYLGDVVAGTGVGAAVALFFWSKAQHGR